MALPFMIGLPGSKAGVDFKSGIDNADEAHQNHEACGEEIHEEFKRVVEIKGADEGLYAEYEKKN